MIVEMQEGELGEIGLMLTVNHRQKNGPTGQRGDLREWLSELIKVFCASVSGASMMPVRSFRSIWLSWSRQGGSQCSEAERKASIQQGETTRGYRIKI